MSTKAKNKLSKEENEKIWKFERQTYIETVERLGVQHEEIAKILNITMLSIYYIFKNFLISQMI